jgi:uncharacterized protein
VIQRQLLRLAFGAALGLVGLGVAASYNVEITRHRLRLPRFRSPLKVVHLTDLHFGPFFKVESIESWVRATMQERPDVIVITGDFVDILMPAAQLRRFIAALGGLQAPLGVFAVLGNHDHTAFGDQIGGFVADLAAVGIEVLHNQGVLLRPDFYLAGVDDLLCGRPDVAAALAGAPSDAACLLLSHNPDLLVEVPISTELTLSGHTHGGQVSLGPWSGSLGIPWTGSSFGERLAQGFVYGPARGYVSRGLGATTLPLRISCPPELAVFELGI